MTRTEGRRASLCWAVMTCFVLLGADAACATDPTYVVRVEETWELNVGEPNLERNGPQISMVMSPCSHLDGYHFVFLLNHRTEPDYAAGGMQLHTWDGDNLVSHRNGPVGAALSHPDEAVTWTQVLTVQDGSVTCEVVGGQSTTWGSFGGQGYLRASVATGQTNLNAYYPAVSIEESMVGFAGNRVSSLVLKRVVWTMNSGQTYELNAPIDIDSDLDPWNNEGASQD